MVEFRISHEVAAPPDPLGPLRGLVGASSSGAATRTWTGTGFNMIWRPNHGQIGSKPYFLQLMFTSEVLTFTEIAGAIANRGSRQNDIAMGGVAYMQQINDTFDDSGQHVEPGVWLNVPSTKNPAAPSSVVRMASIPHGTTVNLQGVSSIQNPPSFPALSISPFPVGLPANCFDLPESDLSRSSLSRTPLPRVVGLDQAHLDNPALFLSDMLADQTLLTSTLLDVSSPVDNAALVGGGIANITFLTGVGSLPTGGPNALVSFVDTGWWIERVMTGAQPEFDQLQYYQLVLIDFLGTSFPHITVATLTAEPPAVEG